MSIACGHESISEGAGQARKHLTNNILECTNLDNLIIIYECHLCKEMNVLADMI